MNAPTMREALQNVALVIARDVGHHGCAGRIHAVLDDPAFADKTRELIQAERQKWVEALDGACMNCLRHAANWPAELAGPEWDDCKDCGTILRDLVTGIEPLALNVPGVDPRLAQLQARVEQLIKDAPPAAQVERWKKLEEEHDKLGAALEAFYWLHQSSPNADQCGEFVQARDILLAVGRIS